MKLSLPDVQGPRILPVVILALVVLIGFRVSNLWVGFSRAEATEGAQNDSIPAPVADAMPAQRNNSAADERILQQLADRRTALDAREAALSTREAVIAAAETQLEARMTEIAEKERALAELSASNDAEVEKEIARLANAYERMKPRDAARIFETLELGLLGDVAAGMRTQSLAAVLGEMDAVKAKDLTEILARRRTGAKPAGAQ